MDTALNKVWLLSELLKKLLPMAEANQKTLDKKFRLEFNYNSNHLEGNTLTYGETELLLIFDETKSSVSHQYREYQEMKAHDAAFSLIKKWAADKEQPLAEAHIRNLNAIILVEPFWKEALTPDGQLTQRLIKIGQYKEFPNSVRLPNGEIFDYVSPADTTIAMGELMDWYHQEEKAATIHPVELAAQFHYRFVRIHPFDDGNGRLSRLLMNYVLLKNDLPPVIIQSADKKNYLVALHQADSGDIYAFIDYIALQLVRSLEISIKAARGESIDEPGDLDKKLAMLRKRMGEDTDIKVVIRKEPASVHAIIAESILPLARAWEKRLQDFDPFFYSRECVVMMDGHRVSGSDLGHLLTSECLSYLYPILDKGFLIQNIHMICQPKGIRKLKREMGLNGGEVQVFLWENTYEVSWSGGQQPINKLYHQQLSPEGIEQIVDRLGNWLIDIVDQLV
jgi:Fic family protein